MKLYDPSKQMPDEALNHQSQRLGIVFKKLICNFLM